jgi:hypothetical protein
MSDLSLVEIERVLMQYWDSVDISDEPKAADEYRVYAGALLNMLKDERNASKIAEYLLSVERGEMKLAGDVSRAQSASRRLLELK